MTCYPFQPDCGYTPPAVPGWTMLPAPTTTPEPTVAALAQPTVPPSPTKATGLPQVLGAEKPPGVPSGVPDLPAGWENHWTLHLPTAHAVSEAAQVLSTGGAFSTVSGAALLTAATIWRWHPARLRNLALGSAVMPATAMVQQWTPTAPLHAFTQGAQVAAGGWWPGGAVGMAVLGVPVAWSISAWLWSRYYHRLVTVGHRSPDKTARIARRFDDADAAAARRAVRYPTPLVLPGKVVLGRCSHVGDNRHRSVLGFLAQRREHWLAIPTKAVDEHLVITGDSGSGKTTLLLRFSASLYAHDWHRYLKTRKERPLTVFVDCGGDLHTGRRFVQTMTRQGVDPRRIGLFPITTRLDAYGMDKPEMAETFQAMLCPAPATDASQVHFENNRRRVISLVVGTARSDAGVVVAKPTSREELFKRLTTSELKKLYAKDKAICEEIDALNESKPPAVADVAGKLRDLFETLGESFEGGRAIGDFDALYICAPGTTRKETARAQVAAVLAMVMQYAASNHDRRIRLIVDEASALADAKGDIGAINIIERARKLRCSMIYAAQSFQGLGSSEDECHRIVNSTSGGWIGMRGTGQSQLCEKYGTRTVWESSRHLEGSRLGAEGTLNTSETMLVHPNKLRRFEPGQAVYVKGLRAIWGQVAPLDLDELPVLPYPDWARREPEPDHTITSVKTAVPQQKSAQSQPTARRAEIGQPPRRRPKPTPKKKEEQE
ncbi:hypothetical protein ACIRRA_13495 [Nocardia sp. NPDC101769]|uniref:hypothetical protein n=1 Tax=Nocardia sp. NPDC101769 TaxID=3364333 RepID=UPI0037F6D784